MDLHPKPKYSMLSEKNKRQERPQLGIFFGSRGTQVAQLLCKHHTGTGGKKVFQSQRSGGGGP